MQPAMVGPYTLLRVLGEGSLGQVLLARTEKGARVALKVFRPELAAYPAFRTRLREEIDTHRLVRNPRVPAVLDADTRDDPPWLATEYVAAPALHEVVAEQGPLELATVRRLGIGLAEALAAVHEAGGVHGDLKPANVLLGPEGPHVTDVGLARAAAATPLTRGGALVGTLGYLAPEQVVDGRAGPASDVFALGSLLLFAATWRRPFGDGDATGVLYRVLHGDPDLRGLAEDVATVVAACTARDPERRPGLAQVRETLRAAAAADGDEVYPAAEVAPVPIGPRHAAAVPVAVPAPRRTLSRTHRVASAAAVSVTLVGLAAVTSADTTLAPHAPFGFQIGR